MSGGEGGIRTLDTRLTYTHFPGVLLQPLGHFSRKLWLYLLTRKYCFALKVKYTQNRFAVDTLVAPGVVGNRSMRCPTSCLHAVVPPATLVLPVHRPGVLLQPLGHLSWLRRGILSYLASLRNRTSHFPGSNTLVKLEIFKKASIFYL